MIARQDCRSVAAGRTLAMRVVWFSSEKGNCSEAPVCRVCCGAGRYSFKVFALSAAACSLGVGDLSLAEAGPLP